MSIMLPDFRVRQRDYLLEIARALTQELDLERLLARILKISIEMLAGQAGLICLRGERGGWDLAVTQGMPAPFIEAIQHFLAEIPDHEDPRQFELNEINRTLNQLTYTASMGLLTGVGLPLVARQQVVGLTFIFRGYATAFSANDTILLGSFANQAAVAVQNAQLYTQVTNDKRRLDALLDSQADGILIIDAHSVVERCNPAFSRLTGLLQDEIAGKTHAEVVCWVRPPEGQTLEQAEAGGWPLTPHAYLYVEGDLIRPNPQPPLPVGITYAPLLSEDGRLLNTIATVRDITRFRQADELKATFISVVSHELKTPVALIKGYVSTLRREDANWDPSIIQDSLAVIEDEADRLAELIENLLEATRLQAGGVKLKLADLSLPELAARMAARFQTQTEKHTLVLNFPDDYPIILADEARLEQVLSNLISNAIKYAPGGKIEISGRILPDSVMVCVADEGPGIAPEDVPHVFDRFYRAPDAARKTKGAGLGLYLTKSIIEAHHGRIWIDTEMGKGAAICFSLPRLALV